MYYVVLIAIALVVFSCTSNTINKRECQWMVKNTSFESKHTFKSGCMIKIGDKWVKDENFITEIDGVIKEGNKK